jgi:N-acetylglucosamine-6-phosphate deacetylase
MIISGNIAGEGRCQWGWLAVEGGKIVATGNGQPTQPADLVHQGIISRGLVDIQVNGAMGFETVGGHLALDRIDAFQLECGVTSYLPTVITAAADTATRAVEEIGERVGDSSSPIAGIHLEGPFLSPSHPGVHRPELLASPADGVPAYYQHPAVRLVTLAPELPGALELIDALVARGVTVSIGHSAANPRTAENAVERGASLVTHLFNAMPTFHHRKPGLVGWAMVGDAVRPSVIPDGRHVAPAALELVHRAAGTRTLLITDASVAAGAPPGDYVQAGTSVRLHSDGCVRSLDGALAGSSIGLDEGVRRWASATSDGLPGALDAGSARPAAAVGLPSRLEAGAPADLVLVDDEGDVVRTMHRGRWVDGADASEPRLYA